MQQWTVQVEAEAPGTSVERAPTDQLIAAFSCMLAAGHEGSAATGDERHWSARVIVHESEPLSPVHSADQAAHYGQMIANGAARTVGMPDWPVVRVEVVPGLLGAQEVAAALGVSRQRLYELRRSPRFPLPVAELRNGPVWSQRAVQGFLARWPRQSGPRPASTVPYVAADGIVHYLTAAADARTGTVWVPVSLAVVEHELQWIKELDVLSSPWNGMSGTAIFRVPRWEWDQRISEDGTPRLLPL